MRRFQSIQAARALSIADLAPSLHRLKAFENRYVLPSSTLVSDAAKHLLENRLTFALVHDDQVSNSAALAASRGGSVVGMITERNLLRYATHAGDLAFFSGREHGEPTLERWMTPREEMMSVKLDDPLEHAASLLHSGVWRHLPVLDYWGKLHSILDVRDVVEALQSEGSGGKNNVWQGAIASDMLAAKRKRRVLEATEVATSGNGVTWQEQLSTYLLQHAARHTISANKPIEMAAHQAIKERLTFLVATEPGGGKGGTDKVIGLVNERSFVKFCASGVPGVSTSSSHTPTASIMTPLEEVLHVSLTSPASEVLDLFFQKNVRHVPVIDGNTLHGILSARDVLRPLML